MFQSKKLIGSKKQKRIANQKTLSQTSVMESARLSHVSTHRDKPQIGIGHLSPAGQVQMSFFPSHQSMMPNMPNNFDFTSGMHNFGPQTLQFTSPQTGHEVD